MKFYTGIDVHGKSCTFVVMDEGGKVLKAGDFATTVTGIESWAEQLQRLQPESEPVVAMESGAVSPFVARQLIAKGIETLIVDAAEVRKKARSKKQKSDGRDAFEICDGLRRDMYTSIVHLPDELHQRMREVLGQRRHFISMRTGEICAVKALFRKRGLGHLYRRLATDAAFDKLLALAQVDALLAKDVQRHRKVYQLLNKQIADLDKELARLAKSCGEAFERLQQVPGVGPVIAMTAMAYFCQPSRFASAKHAASYTGLVPQTYNSGERESYGHITKRGPRELRSMLVEGAQRARVKTHPLHPLYRRLHAKKGPKVAVIAIAHRMARIIFAMLRDGTDFDPRKLHPGWLALEQIGHASTDQLDSSPSAGL